MLRRDFIYQHLRESLLQMMIQWKRENFVPTNRTAADEVVVIYQLKMNAHHISMIIQMLKDDRHLPTLKIGENLVAVTSESEVMMKEIEEGMFDFNETVSEEQKSPTSYTHK